MCYVSIGKFGIGSKSTDFVGWLYASIYRLDINYESPFIVIGIGPIWFFLALFWAFLIVKYFGAKKEGMILVIKIFFCIGCALSALIIVNEPLQYMGFVSKKK